MTRTALDGVRRRHRPPQASLRQHRRTTETPAHAKRSPLSPGRLPHLHGTAAAPRRAERAGRGLPAPGGPDHAHAHRRRRDLPRQAAAVRRLPRAHPRPPRPRAALPPEARLPAGRDRPPALDRRPALQPRVPRPQRLAAAARARDEQLRKLVGRIYSERLDRAKPLWELLLVEGLSGGRFAIISKTHHSVVDGVSGIDIATALFDVSRDQQPRRRARAPGSRSPSPRRPSSPRVAVSGNAREVATLPAKALATVADRTRLRGLGEALMTVLRPAPDLAAQRRDRLAPARRVRARRSSTTSRPSRTPSAAPSTTSSSPSPPARCATGCTAAGSRPRALELRAARPRVDPLRRGPRLARQPAHAARRAAAGRRRRPGRAAAPRPARR